MSVKTKGKHHFLCYFLALMSSLSSAAASMTLIALSASLYSVDAEGTASSIIYVLYYFGIGIVGLLGGWILQRFTAINIGLMGGLLCSLILYYLSSFSFVDPAIGLPCVFIIFLISGIDHPNSLRFFNEVLDEKDKISFFSIKETLMYILNLAAPPLAALIITIWGARVCFFIDGTTYLLGCLPWLFLKRRKISTPSESKPDWLVGFKFLLKDKNIFYLTLSRLFNNLSYVTWTTILPILIAKMASGNVKLFAQEQAFSTSFVSIGFIAASLVSLRLGRQNNLIVPMMWSASLFGLIGMILSIFSLHQNLLLYISALFIGMGTYCFRISGMTLGQAFTPKEILGAVIIAGDTVVRSWSFMVSMLAIAIFEFHEAYELSNWLLYFFILLLPLISLASPFILGAMASNYSLKKAKESDN